MCFSFRADIAPIGGRLPAILAAILFTRLADFPGCLMAATVDPSKRQICRLVRRSRPRKAETWTLAHGNECFEYSDLARLRCYIIEYPTNKGIRAMLAEATATAYRSSLDARQKGRVWLAGRLVDRRSREWKRRVELVEAYVAAFGGPDAVDDVLASKIEMTAEMRVIAELSRAKFLADTGGVSLEDIVRLENQAARAERALALPKRTGHTTAPTPADDALVALVRRMEPR